MARNGSPFTSSKFLISSGSDRLTRHGLALPQAVLRGLEGRGIYCQPGISVEHQHLAKRYVLRATESGGAVAELGRYCAFVDAEGKPIPWLQPLDSIGGNGRHALIIASELIRIEMLRVEHTYDVVISRHALNTPGNGSRPALASTVLFRGREGTLTTDLWKQDNRHLRESMAPAFYTSSGEILAIPPLFIEAIRKVTGAVSCIRCTHAHIATSRLLDRRAMPEL
ncbi:MAG: hypothetical protein WDN23_05385 [Edaphobacter sp.]